MRIFRFCHLFAGLVKFLSQLRFLPVLMGLDDGHIAVAGGLEGPMRLDGVHGGVAMLDGAVWRGAAPRTSVFNNLIDRQSLAFNLSGTLRTVEVGVQKLEVVDTGPASPWLSDDLANL